MSEQAQLDLNAYPYQFILYYCNTVEPLEVYPTDLSSVCTAGYNTQTGNLQINTWLEAYDEPSMEILMGYPVADVLAWYHNFYELPVAIADHQYLKFTGTEIAAIRTDSSMIGFVV